MPASTPLCRCRVLYIGSSVPLKSKDGLQGIQEPLRQLYPVDDPAMSVVTAAETTRGVDTWLSVWVNGLVSEYVEEDKELFFPIQTLHYCAAVRYVNVAGYALQGGGEKFLPLDSPFANLPDTNHPPIFAAILRRTQGIKVLECHAFVCTNEKAANALVRCCFNAYADSMYLGMTGSGGDQDAIGPAGSAGVGDDPNDPQSMGGPMKAAKSRNFDSRSNSPTKSMDDHDSLNDEKNGYDSDGGVSGGDDKEKEQQKWTSAKAKYNWQQRQQTGDFDAASISSSVAGKYKKKTSKQQQQGQTAAHASAGTIGKNQQFQQQKRSPSVAASYSNALVPYQPPGGGGAGPWGGADPSTMDRRRARSEPDIRVASRQGALVPYFPPHGGHFPPGGGFFPPGGGFFPPGPPFFPPGARFFPPPPHGPHRLPPPPMFMPPPFPMRGPHPPPGGGGPPMMSPPPFPGGPMFPPPPPPNAWHPGVPPKGKNAKKRNSKKSRRYPGTPEPPDPIAYGMMPPPPPTMRPPQMFDEPPYMPPNGGGRMPPFPMMAPGPGSAPPFMRPPMMHPGDAPPFGPPFPMDFYPLPEDYAVAAADSSARKNRSSKSRHHNKSLESPNDVIIGGGGGGGGRRSAGADSTNSSRHSGGGHVGGRPPDGHRSPPIGQYDYWESRNVYDGCGGGGGGASLFKRQHLNEKAFGSSMQHHEKTGPIRHRRGYGDEERDDSPVDAQRYPTADAQRYPTGEAQRYPPSDYRRANGYRRADQDIVVDLDDQFQELDITEGQQQQQHGYRSTKGYYTSR